MQFTYIMVTTQCVFPPLPSQLPPATVHFFNMHPLSPEQKSNIIFMLESGQSVRHIASKLGVGKSTIGEVQSQIKSSLKDNLGGCPSKLTPQNQHHLVQLVSTGKADTATQLQCQLLSMTNTPLSTQTI
jgi:transposase